MLDDVGPLDHHDNLRVVDNFDQLVGHDARLVQTVKIKVVDFEFGRFVYLADRERRAGDFVVAAGAARQAAHKGGLAAAQVADQLNNFTAL